MGFFFFFLNAAFLVVINSFSFFFSFLISASALAPSFTGFLPVSISFALQNDAEQTSHDPNQVRSNRKVIDNGRKNPPRGLSVRRLAEPPGRLWHTLLLVGCRALIVTMSKTHRQHGDHHLLELFVLPDCHPPPQRVMGVVVSAEIYSVFFFCQGKMRIYEFIRRQKV